MSILLLLIDEDESRFRQVQARLRERVGAEMQLDWDGRFEAALESIARGRHDAYLIDHGYAPGDGAARIEAAVAAGCQAPLILVSERDDVALDARVMRVGAADYLLRDDLYGPALERCVRHAIERQRLRRELEHERHLLHTLLENLPDYIYFKDAAGRYLRINRALGQRLGIADPQQAVGRSDAEFFPAAYAGEAETDERALVAAGATLVDKIENPTWPDGSRTWVSTTKTVLRDPAGQVIGTCGISRDITQRKRDEKTLRDAKEAAEAASRAKSDFLANVSHEIRTPLNAVIGMTELVLDTPLQDAQREYLEMVRAAGESLSVLINDILDFSKIEAGKLELDRIVFPLRENLGDTMKTLAVRAGHKGLELMCHVGEEVPDSLCGDPARLRQVLVNLVGNAIKFTERGEILVDVAACETAAENEVVLHVGVSDTGIGIPREKIRKIFEAFEQVDASTTRQYGGTGLGLAISTRLVDLMGGRIWVESELGQGSSFHFTATMGVCPDGYEQSREGRRVVLSGTRVLIVDDNLTNRFLLREMFQSWGMLPVLAESADKGLALLREQRAAGQPVRLVLSDVNMPLKDGFDFVAAIRQDPRLADTVVVMLSSAKRQGDSQRAERLGVVAHLMKPAKQSELFNAIVRALGVNSAEDEQQRRSMPARSRCGPRRILLVEDSPFNQKLALGLLERHRHEVQTASNGREAVAAFARQPFDLVLMDVQMPEMDGFEATAQIRAWERDHAGHVPIIAMTARAMKGDREQCLAAGMDAYIAKPIRAKELYETIDLVCRGPLAASPATSVALEPPRAPVATSPEATAQEATAPETTAPETTAPEAAPCAVVNWSAALDAVQGRRELLDELVDIFLAETPRLLEELCAAVQRDDAPGVQLHAHTLKGSLRYFHATHAADLAFAMETKGRQRNLAGTAEELPVVERAVAQVVAELERRKA